ncbi:MAG TPA: response regulator [Gemmatimonadales bacterium]|nr:response regulator [Gemmatimonadales bacterium]
MPDPAVWSMRILIVEDDYKLGSLLEEGLAEEGFATAWVRDGEAALAAALGDEYDLILLDLMLPRKDGLEVTLALRAAGRQTPILMLTARDAPEDLERARRAGVNDLMGKPFRFAELVQRIRTLAPDAVNHG